MELEKWRIKKGLTYENLSRKLGMTTSKVYRICKQDPCIRLRDANEIVCKTNGEVDFADLLLEGDC